MKIAIPIANNQLCMHFGHCEQFALIEIDPESKTIVGREDHTPPPHQPGLLPVWLAEKGTEIVLAGGMGQRAQQIFATNGIMVLTGVPGGAPEQIVSNYLANQLQTGENVCDH